MISNRFLIKKETIINEFFLRHSLIFFFLTSQFVLTDKRLLGKINNVFWIIPTGTQNVTYLLDNIAGVRLGEKTKIKSLVFSLLILLTGLAFLKSFMYLGFVLVLLGKIGIVDSRQKIIVVEDKKGTIMSYSVSRMNKTKVNELINVINNTIAKKSINIKANVTHQLYLVK